MDPSGEASEGSEVNGEPDSARECVVAETLDSAQILAEMRQLMRLRHYASRTERSYLGWVRRFLKYVSRTGGCASMPENAMVVHPRVADDGSGYVQPAGRVIGRRVEVSYGNSYPASFRIPRKYLFRKPDTLHSTDRRLPRIPASDFPLDT